MTVMLAVPLEMLGVGVKVPVLVRPVPLTDPSVPPETARSPVVPFHEKLVPGSSEKVNVMTAVSLVFKVNWLLLITKSGARVSTTKTGWRLLLSMPPTDLPH